MRALVESSRMHERRTLTRIREARIFLVAGLVALCASLLIIVLLVLAAPAPSVFMVGRHIASAALGLILGSALLAGAFGLRQSKRWARWVLGPLCWLALFAIPLWVVLWLWRFVPSLVAITPRDRALAVLVPFGLAVILLLMIVAAACIWLVSVLRDLGALARQSPTPTADPFEGSAET